MTKIVLATCSVLVLHVSTLCDINSFVYLFATLECHENHFFFRGYFSFFQPQIVWSDCKRSNLRLTFFGGSSMVKLLKHCNTRQTMY